MAKPDYDDPFAPSKDGEREFRCLHCGRIVNEQEITYEERFGRTLWWCPNQSCDGAGVGFDLHRIDDHE
jgi:hypothetical protein